MNKNQTGSDFTSQGKNMLYLLIAVNVIIYILGIKKPLSSDNLFSLQIISSIFSHANFGHLFFNMFSLYVFGNLIANRVGFWKFLGLFLSAGIVGNLTFMALFHSGAYQLLGASGAVFGVMMATAMLEPNQKFMMIFLPFFSLKTKTLVVAFTIIELVSQARGNSATAHLAHLGGFLGGYIFTKIFLKNLILWDILDLLKKRKKNFQNVQTPKWKAPTTHNYDTSSRVTQKELDYLLDKISQNGVNSLSEEEISRLKQARKEMRGDA